MKKELEAIRAGLAQAKKERRRVDPELRRETVAMASLAIASGMSEWSVARALGIRGETLKRWRGTSKGKLSRVRVTAARPRGGLTIHGPGGLWVEGASFEEVVALWRRLG